MSVREQVGGFIGSKVTGPSPESIKLEELDLPDQELLPNGSLLPAGLTGR